MNTTCGHGPHYARGLCKTCYMRAMRNSTLDKYPKRQPKQNTPRPVTPAMQSVIDEIEQGFIKSMKEANRLGKTPAALERALHRAGRYDLIRRLREYR